LAVADSQRPEALKELFDRLRDIGPTGDLRAVEALYAPLLAQQPLAGVRCERDLVYGPHERHRVDVYTSEPVDARPRPVLAVFHGGGFLRGDKSQRANFGHCFAREGFITAVANYRLAPETGWPGGADDIVRLTQWLRQEALRLGGDPSRVFLLGESAGAAHVASAVLMRERQPEAGLPVAGAVLISGPYNARLEGLARSQFGIATPDLRNEAYFGPDRQAWGEMSTVDHITAAPPPILITFAEMDLLQMQVQACELFARLVCGHGHAPQLQMIRHHNHFSQVMTVNSGDRTLVDPVLAFLRKPHPAAD
jgi:acetyl esterase/lipase